MHYYCSGSKELFRLERAAGVPLIVNTFVVVNESVYSTFQRRLLRCGRVKHYTARQGNSGADTVGRGCPDTPKNSGWGFRHPKILVYLVTLIEVRRP